MCRVAKEGITLLCLSHRHACRSIYRKADVYILDDPLSAVDTIVGRRLFETCLNGVLRNSVVVLVTHQLQYAQLADTMLVLDQVGTSEAACTFCGRLTVPPTPCSG